MDTFIKVVSFPIKILWKITQLILQVALLAGVGFAVWFLIQQTGIIPVGVPVTGASMLPTLPEQGLVMFKRFPQLEQLQPKLQRGDIVVFGNVKTAEELQKQQKFGGGFVKRVIGVPGDTIMIRDGYVYVNNTFLNEPYTLKPHSTFGGTEVLDCQEITIPTGNVFVLGDNRKLSMDSRHIGLISNKDVQFYIPLVDQKDRFGSKWRDTTKDKESVDTSTFEIYKYLTLLNQERAKHGVKPLILQTKLNESAQKRAEAMLRYNDMSFEATRSGYTMQQALNEVGYSNSVYGEFPVLGYYDAQELFDAFLEQEHTKEFLLNKEYEEMGISTFVGELNGCPVQIMVQHFAGYKPPNYPQGVINSWKRSLDSLREIQPSWSQVRENVSFYESHKTDVDRINEIIITRMTRTEAILSRMEANQWLTDEEKRFMDEDDLLSREQNEIAQRLNGR